MQTLLPSCPFEDWEKGGSDLKKQSPSYCAGLWSPLEVKSLSSAGAPTEYSNKNNVSVKSRLQHAPPPPGIPRAFDTFAVLGRRNLITRVFQGVGNLIPMLLGWGIWTAPSISREIFGVASYHRGRGIRGFCGKDCVFVANWLRGKGLKKLCAVFEVFKF